MAGITGSLLSRRSIVVMGVFSLTVLIITIFSAKPSIPLWTAPDRSAPLAKSTPSHVWNEAAGKQIESLDGLSDEDCAFFFPDLYKDVDRAVAFWKNKAYNISAKDIDIAESKSAMRVLIHENELRILESNNAIDPVDSAIERTEGVLHLIHRALDSAMAAGEVLPTIEVSLVFRDEAELQEGKDRTDSYWAFARQTSRESHQRVWMMPNYDFWYYEPTGSFSDAKREAMQHDAAFVNKIPKVVWRGNPDFNKVRESLMEVTNGMDWADVVSIHDLDTWMRGDEFCKYAMTAYTEGYTYSGRLKFLMNCQSLLFAHTREYETHYSHLLVKDGPEQNYVPTERDWGDLEEKVKWYLEHPEEAERIIANMLRTFRSRCTTRAATSCYVRRLIRGYSEVAWTPETHVPMQDGSGVRLRGWSFEKFIHSPGDSNFEQMDD